MLKQLNFSLPHIHILSNNFSRLLPIFFVPPTTAEKAIYSEAYNPN